MYRLDNMTDEEYGRLVEMIRQGVTGEFWDWLQTEIKQQTATIMSELMNRNCQREQMDFLRGGADALTWLLGLPVSMVRSFDSEQIEETVEPDIPVGRRPSPAVEEPDIPAKE